MRPPGSRHVLTFLWYSTPVLVVATTLLMIGMLGSAIPENDYWNHIQWISGFQKHGFAPSDLFRQANEHRIALPRLVFFLDDTLVRSTGWLCLAVIFMSMGVLSWLIAAVYDAPLRRENARAFGIFLIVCLAFLFTQSENFLWEGQVQFVFVYMFAALSIHLALRCADAGRGRAVLLHAGTATAITATVYSMANGLLVLGPIVLLFMVHRNWRAVGFYGFLGLILGYVYLNDYHRPPHHPDPLQGELADVVAHFALSMGGYASKISSALGAMLGGFGVLYACERGYRWMVARRPAAQHEMFSLLFVLFILGSMALTSFGRAEFGVMQGVASRYQTPVNLFWINVLLLLFLDPRLAPGMRRRLVGAVTAVVAGLAVAGQIHSLRWELGHSSRLAYAEDALAAGVPDVEVLTRVYPDPRLVLELTDFLRAESRSFYAEARYGKLAQVTADAPDWTIADTTRFESRYLAGYGHEGWLVLADLPIEGRHFNTRVSVADRCGRMVGFGRLFNAATDLKPSLFHYATGRQLRLRAYLAASTLAPNHACSGDAATPVAAPGTPAAPSPAALVLVR